MRPLPPTRDRGKCSEYFTLLKVAKLNTMDLDVASLASLDPIAVRPKRPVERRVCERTDEQDARDLDPAALLRLDPMAVRVHRPDARQGWQWPRMPYLGPRATSPIPRTALLVPVIAAVVVILGVL
jgi:hypothetical protein